MYTHPHFQQENKSQGAANLVYQRRGEKSSVLQLEDNRPEAISQAKIQRMIAYSPRVKQMKRMQGIINGSPKVKQNSSIRGDGIVQMRPLVPKEFNIAGEDHKESDSVDSNKVNRRDKERDFCREKVGGGYWQESEFKNGRHFADPPEYRAQAWIILAIEKLKEATEYLTSPSVFKDIISNAEDYIKHGKVELKRIEKDKTFSPVSNAMKQKEKVEKWIKKIDNIIFDLEKPKKQESAKEQAEKLLVEAKNEKNDRNKEDKSVRTIDMEKASSKANEQHIIGVWKVGNNHIVSIDNDKITTTRQEFNEGYDEWKKKKEENNSQEVKKLPQQENP